MVIAVGFNRQQRENIHSLGVNVTMSLASGSDPLAQWMLGAREESIARCQIDHLVATGHRHIGYARPLDSRIAEASALRLRALSHACASYGLDEPVALQVQPAFAADAIAGWTSRASPVTAVCANDETSALAVLSGLRAHGLSAPKDMAVIGVGDSLMAALADPPLTTVAIDWIATADYTVETVMSAIEGRQAADSPDVATLVLRSSV